MTKFRSWLKFVLALAFLAVLVVPNVAVLAEDPPDQLESYTISVIPQQDGSLIMDYKLDNYCVAIDAWPTDEPYLQIGVPNSNFTITEWGPKEGPNKVINAEVVNNGGSFVQLDFDKSGLPKKGDCFDLNFSIVQNHMAYPDPENSNITFKFIPAGWTFPIQVKTLTLVWALPVDTSLIKLTDPAPTASGSGSMVWQWNNPSMDAAGMFSAASIKLAYDKSTFTLSDAAKTNNDGANGGSPDLATICLWVIVVIVIIVLVLWIFGAIIESIDSGDSLGTSFVTVAGNTIDAIDEISNAGGSGGSGGHSSGCACAGCACACACAGGGRVGCSRKAIGIACLDDAIEEMVGKE